MTATAMGLRARQASVEPPPLEPAGAQAAAAPRAQRPAREELLVPAGLLGRVVQRLGRAVPRLQAQLEQRVRLEQRARQVPLEQRASLKHRTRAAAAATTIR